jgi:hypothetical protein
MSTKKSNPTPQRAKKKSLPTLEEIAEERVRAQLPTHAAFVELAARLATRYPHMAIGLPQAHTLAREALDLWMGCEEFLEEKIKDRVRWGMQSDTLAAELAAIPPAKKYPVPLDEFLKKFAGGKPKADRLPLYRAYLKERGNRGILSEAEVDKGIEFAQRTPFDEWWYRHTANGFLRWQKDRVRAAKLARASAGGKALSEKRKMNQEKIS